MMILPRQARDKHRENSKKDAFLQVCIRDGRLDTAVYGDTSGGWLEVRQFHDDQATTEGAKRVVFAANILAGKNDRLPRQARVNT